MSLSLLIACLVLLLACFLAGLLAELALAQRVLRSVESLILAKIPGYTLMKSVGENLLGVEGQEDRQTVLVRFERTSQIGFLMSTLPDGRLVVFVPNVPHAMSGTLHIVEPECAEPLPLKIGDTLHTLGRLGADLGNAWAAAPLGAIPSQHPTPTHDEPRPLPGPSTVELPEEVYHEMGRASRKQQRGGSPKARQEGAGYRRWRSDSRLAHWGSR